MRLTNSRLRFEQVLFVMRRSASLLVLMIVASGGIAFADGDKIDYLTEVKPILAARCFSCHGGLKQESGLRLDTAVLMRKGGEGGAAVVPGDTATSLLLERISATDEFVRMPPEGKPLTKTQIETIAAWIKLGATAPADEKPEEDARRYWSFLRPVRPAVPHVKNREWVHNPIDAFIAARHEAIDLTPTPPATRPELLRRVYIDLIGLPPTRKQLHAFLADHSADAYEKVVDRLLDSPQYGERWGRHWMDVWRYSDWYGRRSVNDVRNSYPHIWRWRDWIVRSLNEDKGYDQMVREMLAADEIAPEDDETIAALGFIVRNWFSLNYDTWKQDLVEHTGKAFLGLRFNCAHCHDHKYDPILQKEYFAFRAFFEPLELRQDRVPGGVALTKYLRYTPSGSGALKPIKSGLPRVYDHYFDEATYMYKLGDPRDRFDGPPVTPATPAFLDGPKIATTIEQIKLPPVASYPGLKPFAQRAEIEQRKQAVKSAEAELDMLKQPPTEAAKLVAAAQLAEARAELAAVEARIAADNSKYRGEPGDPILLAQAASKAERQAQLAAAQLQQTQAQQAVTVAGSDAKALKKAQAALTAAKKSVDAAQNTLAKVSIDYTPLGPKYPTVSTGRRKALAEWIGNRQNPLTARVAVNHIWMRHFGRPIVESVFDFGRSGKLPSHPGLIDWLAVELMQPSVESLPQHAWSMKHIHRLIVTSNAYRMSSKTPVDSPNLNRDKDNRWWWRFDRQRMQAEVVRDSILHVAGALDTTIGGEELDLKLEATTQRRSMYYTVYPEGGGMMKFMATFDPADPIDCYRRKGSIVPQQALALSNSQLAIHHGRLLARALAADVQKEGGDAAAQQASFIIAAFEQILTRSPTKTEREFCAMFLKKQQELYGQRNQKAGAPAKGVVAAATDPQLRARESLVRVLLNHNDFVTIH
jgi:hypothetical protein